MTVTTYVLSNPPIKGSAYSFEMGLFSQADTKLIQDNPTLAAGDVIVKKDGVLDGNIDTLPVAVVGETRTITVTLSATEMNCNRVSILFHDVAGAQWCDMEVYFSTVQAANIGTVAEIADGVWDEILTGATHNIATSAGRRLRQLGASSVASGTAQAGTTNSITLELGSSATNNIFAENLIAIVDNTGAGQCRMIAEYDGATLKAIVDRDWEVTPDDTSEYQIMAFSGILLTHHGLALAGTINTVKLAANASTVDDIYVGSMFVPTTGGGAGQARLITDYDGVSQIAVVSPDFVTIPDVTTVYKIIPVGRAIIESIKADAIDANSIKTDAVAEIWNYVSRTLTQSAREATESTNPGTLELKRGDTWSQPITELGSLAGYTYIDFVVKQSEEDLDAKAIVWIRKAASGLSDGLLILNGAEGTALEGSITIDDETLGNITINLTATATDDLELDKGLYYDVQKIAGTAVLTMGSGVLNVNSDIARAVT